MLEDGNDTLMLELATGIVSAYVAHNRMPAAELPALLRTVHGSLDRLNSAPVPEPVAEPQQPAVSVKKSVTDDYVICLEDGRKFKSLKRHLASSYGMTPEQYRAKWNLPKDYPMVAPSYASKRSELARRIGLGRKAEA